MHVVARLDETARAAARIEGARQLKTAMAGREEECAGFAVLPGEIPAGAHVECGVEDVIRTLDVPAWGCQLFELDIVLRVETGKWMRRPFAQSGTRGAQIATREAV